MSRTTLTIEDDLLRRLKEAAARENRSLAGLVNALLRQALAAPALSAGYHLKIEGWEATQLPGVDIMDRDKLFDLLDGR